MLVLSVGFPQQTFDAVTINGTFKISFGYGYCNLYARVFRRGRGQVKEFNGKMFHGITFGKNPLQHFFALDTFALWEAKIHG